MSFMHGPCGTWYQDLCVFFFLNCKYLDASLKGLTIRETYDDLHKLYFFVSYVTVDGKLCDLRF